MKVDIAGVKIDAITKTDAAQRVKNFVRNGGRHYIVTPYSEQVVFALSDNHYKQILNQADLSLPDGIGVLWAERFLSIHSRNIFSALFQVIYTGAAIIFNRKYIRTVIPEQITGSRFVYDIIKLAHENNFSLAFVGGAGNVAAQAAYELKKRNPNLRINLALSERPFDNQIVKEIAESNSDILFVAYSPPKQEKWIAENLPNLNVKLAIGLGGTFDYIAGKRLTPPNFMHSMGLEWLWRLITQPWRFKRIWNAVPVFVFKILKYKINGSRSTN